MQVVNKTLVKIHNKRTGFLCDITKNKGNKTAPFLKTLYIMRVKQRKRFLKNIVKTSCRRKMGTAAGGLLRKRYGSGSAFDRAGRDAFDDRLGEDDVHDQYGENCQQNEHVNLAHVEL